MVFHTKPISKLQSITCHMGLHSVTCQAATQHRWYSTWPFSN